METTNEQVYCPACKREVHVAFTTAPLHEGQANLRDGELVCLDCGEGCPSGTCPLSGLAHPVMALRLATSGMAEPVFTAQMTCKGCGQPTEMQMVDRTTLRCPLCGTINRWIMMQVTGKGWVAIGNLEAD